ncbi:hypothetical protein [Urbifossiella limnaea]|uniref:Uncharacterized protein n=1 Tax=Urbifossiella limnaea TaxID=2528023 RepID=A0A517XQV1_9BACT|nr:hypothetical protein [Urbifossiella limnaea]QDU19877.1 hypothetical protein ETAA1_18150 [Urbifossiella limnaea]
MKPTAPRAELSLAQQSAVDLLAAGKNDTETAAAVGLNRVTVTRWRLYSPEFRAALADRRAAVWGASADRLRALLPQAIDALADALQDADTADRVDVALAVLKLAGPIPLVPAGPTDPDEIVRAVVEAERERLRDRDEALDEYDGLPDHDAHTKAVRKRLALLASPPDPPAAVPALPCGRADDGNDRP